MQRKAQDCTLPMPLAGAGGAGMLEAAAVLAAAAEADEPCDAMAACM
jgi:hypothetical protein